MQTSCRIEIIAIFVFPAPVGAQTCKNEKKNLILMALLQETTSH